MGNTVYDAFALAIREFRSGSIAARLPRPLIEFSVAMDRVQVTHRLKQQQVTR